MSEYSKKSFNPSCIQGAMGGILTFLGFLTTWTCCLGQEPAWLPPQDSVPWNTFPENPPLASPSALEPAGSNDLPRIKSFGKLVSIEGKSGDPGSLREFNGDASERSDLGAELPSDPYSNPALQMPELSYFSSEPYLNYRADEESLNYLPGDGDNFGWLSFESSPYVKRGYHSGFTTAFNLHLLSGPNVFALPPRLYDFSLGYQRRRRLNDFLSYDLAASVGVFSDFEDSAKEGVRYPGHAVGMLHLKPELDWVFGVDYLSRDDIKILPVCGVSWRPQAMPDMRFDLVFPRPRIDYAINNESKVYMAGRLGGGTWDIEFPNNDNDVLTYRDLQILFGFESKGDDGDTSSVEFGYVFDRRVQFRTLDQSAEFDNAFVFRYVTRK